MTSSYTNKNFTSSEKMKPEKTWHGRIPFSSTVDATDYVVLDNVRAIGAAAGTTLKFEGATAPVVHGLKVDAAGSGTIDGFSFAAGDGTLYVENVDPGATAIDVPADFRNATGLANVAGWSLCVNGAENGKYAITSVTAGSIRIIKHGFRIVIR